MQVIIYNQDDGIPAVISPTPEALEKFGIMAIAVKDVPSPKTVYDVPTGVFETDPDTGEQYEVMGPRTKVYPFKIVDVADLPDAPQETWVVDDADLTDGIGGQSNEFD